MFNLKKQQKYVFRYPDNWLLQSDGFLYCQKIFCITNRLSQSNFVLALASGADVVLTEIVVVMWHVRCLEGIKMAGSRSSILSIVSQNFPQFYRIYTSTSIHFTMSLIQNLQRTVSKCKISILLLISSLYVDLNAGCMFI